MPRLQYGSTAIDWQFKPDEQLKRHYVTVERDRPVLLRGPRVDVATQEALVRQRARWIREKLAVVNLPPNHDAVVTGCRLKYGGRTYFTEVRQVPGLARPALHFTAARFVVSHPESSQISQAVLAPLLLEFYRCKAQERLVARVRHWGRASGLQAMGTRIKVFDSRWASCSAHNVLEFHRRVMELPASVQDYVVVHELCHTTEKSHTRAFWRLVETHMPDWRRHHQALEAAAFGDAV